MDSLIGQHLGKYRIDRLLGEGGMGAVYQAQDTILARTVAIKIMHRQYSQQHDFQERFLQEARTAARLNHPAIVKVYAFEELEGQLSISMEFIPGENLRQVLESMMRERTWLALPEAVKVIAHIALALDYAHRQGVFHRDVKPANIMLRQDPERAHYLQPILTDLGLAKLAEGGMVTQANVTMGTPAYMSPEQASRHTTDARSDVYSLGVLLYELATGQLPFPIHTLTEAKRYHVHEQAPHPRTLHPGLPPVLEQVILRMMEKDAAQRYASAREVVQVLSSIPLSELAVPVPPTAVAGARNVTIATLHYPGIEPLQPLQPPSEPSPQLPGVANSYLEIIGPDGTTRTINIKQRSLSIGRDGNNDVVLQDGRVSRQHAKLDFDGAHCRITDLNSSNGCYLGQSKLAKGGTDVWRTEVDLRLGDHRLRYVLPSPPSKPPRRRLRAFFLWLLLLLVAVGLVAAIWFLAGSSLLYRINGVVWLEELENLEPPNASADVLAATYDDTDLVVRYDNVKWWDVMRQKLP